MLKIIRGLGASTISPCNDGNESIPRKFLCKRELASVLGISERTIENWLAKKLIPQLRFSPRLTRFSLPKVLAALGRYEVQEVGRRK